MSSAQCLRKVNPIRERQEADEDFGGNCKQRIRAFSRALSLRESLYPNSLSISQLLVSLFLYLFITEVVWDLTSELKSLEREISYDDQTSKEGTEEVKTMSCYYQVEILISSSVRSKKETQTSHIPLFTLLMKTLIKHSFTY